MLGLILYLRMGYVVGNLGMGFSVAAILLGGLLSWVTSRSASAILTNNDVGEGGVYYLVSRSLGLETGGAIGLAFYVSRTLSLTFYCYGLSEALLWVWPHLIPGILPRLAPQVVAVVLIVTVTILSAISRRIMHFLQAPAFLLIILSLLALAIGVLTGPLHPPVWRSGQAIEYEGFWLVFAVFFPGVTGWLAGITTAGHLRSPWQAMPRGVLQAIVAGTLIYMLASILLGVSDRLSPVEMSTAETGVNVWVALAFGGGAIILPAAWAAIFTSAVGSMLGGPKVLQTMAKDGLAPAFLGQVTAKGHPRAATWLTGGIAVLAVVLGDLNLLARFVTILFLTLYVVVNLVAATEKLVSEPSYRPKVDLPWQLSMGGAIAALIIMYFISPVAMVAAVGLELTAYIYFKKKALAQQWGDVTAGFWMKIARFALLQINARTISTRNWRPLILVFVKDIHDRIELVKLAAAFGQNRGVLSVAKLISTQDEEAREHRPELKRQMLRELEKYGLEAFCEVDVVNSIHTGIRNISKGHGIAGLKTNTVMFGWSGNAESNAKQLRIIRDLAIAGKNIILARFNDHEAWKDPHHRIIDIWWSGHENNGDLMLILAFMLRLNREWEGSRIRVQAVVESEVDRMTWTSSIERSLAKSRIPASVSLHMKRDEGFRAILQRESMGADIVFLGLKHTEEGEEAIHTEKLQSMGEVAKTVVFVQNNNVEEKLPVLLERL